MCQRQSLLSIRRLSDLTTVSTPGGMITAEADPDAPYPGIALSINGTGATVVEWHEVEQCFVLRTYNDHEDESQPYHRWDGTPIAP